jgi:hypothetical protein
VKPTISEGGKGWSDGQTVNALRGDGMNLSPAAPKNKSAWKTHLASYKIVEQIDRANRHTVLEVWDCQTTYSGW